MGYGCRACHTRGRDEFNAIPGQTPQECVGGTVDTCEYQQTVVYLHAFFMIAQFKAKHLELAICNDINSPSDLYWHRQSKKKEPYPCRLCQESELVLAPQLQTKSWNKTTQVLIQFMGEYQPNQRQLVLKSQLTDSLLWKS